MQYLRVTCAIVTRCPPCQRAAYVSDEQRPLGTCSTRKQRSVCWHSNPLRGTRTTQSIVREIRWTPPFPHRCAMLLVAKRPSQQHEDRFAKINMSPTCWMCYAHTMHIQHGKTDALRALYVLRFATRRAETFRDVSTLYSNGPPNGVLYVLQKMIVTLLYNGSTVR